MLTQTSMIIRLILVSAVSLSLMSCAAISTAVSKRNLDVQTKVSTAIFVDPVPRPKRTVYVDIRSTVQEFDRRAMAKIVRAEFKDNDNGYRMIDDPTKAQFHLSIFVLKLEKSSPTAAEQALRQGYNDRGAAVASGAIIGGQHRGTATGAVVGGLAATMATTAANAFVQDVMYVLVADIQIKEKARKGVLVRKDSKINTKISDSGGSTQTVSEATNRKEYRTRIVTTANKVNLDMEEAQPVMFKKTAYAMSGFF